MECLCKSFIAWPRFDPFCMGVFIFSIHRLMKKNKDIWYFWLLWIMSHDTHSICFVSWLILFEHDHFFQTSHWPASESLQPMAIIISTHSHSIFFNYPSQWISGNYLKLALTDLTESTTLDTNNASYKNAKAKLLVSLSRCDKPILIYRKAREVAQNAMEASESVHGNRGAANCSDSKGEWAEWQTLLRRGGKSFQHGI